jgi:hypothetical protein
MHLILANRRATAKMIGATAKITAYMPVLPDVISLGQYRRDPVQHRT